MQSRNPEAPGLAVAVFLSDLAKQQHDYPTPTECFQESQKSSTFTLLKEHFLTDNCGRQLILTKTCREEVLRVGHTIIIITHTCCHAVGKQRRSPPVVLLHPLPDESEPFAHIMIDCTYGAITRVQLLE